MEKQLAGEKQAAKKAEEKLKSLHQAPDVLQLEGVDLEIACMKYRLWKPKMTCGSCTGGAGNDVEVFLPCGHMLCHICLAEIK